VTRLQLAVLVSGGGRSLQNLVERSRDGRLDGDVALVLSNSPGAFALERAKNLDIPSRVIRPRDFDDVQAFSNAVFDRLDAERIDLAVMAGYLVRLPLVQRWRGRVLNIHPSLLPAFGGHGCYGDRVHQAVLAAGATESGCTVHFVDDEYDHGPVILQRKVVVRDGDTPHDLAARVFEQEKEALPEAINLYAAGRLALDLDQDQDQVRILPEPRNDTP